MTGLGPLLSAGLNRTQGNIYDINDKRMAIANRMRPDMSPAELAYWHDIDKNLELRQVRDKTNQEIFYAWAEGREERKKKLRGLRDRMLESGSLFVPLIIK